FFLQEEIEFDKSQEEIGISGSNSSSKDSPLICCLHCDCEGRLQAKYVRDYGSCNSRLTDEVSKKVKDALSRVDYPFSHAAGKCCKLCKHSRIRLPSEG
ncbi:hypothetical protein J437_LFUL001920, partial [Ladona fulva]